MTKKTGAETRFIFIPSKDWKEIDKFMKKEKCLRCGVIKVEEKGVRILCAKSS
ncbi:MAG: hypothetical protein ACP5N9_00755 [Candidatus Bilamarchaeum sp.]